MNNDIHNPLKPKHLRAYTYHTIEDDNCSANCSTIRVVNAHPHPRGRRVQYCLSVNTKFVFKLIFLEI